MKLLEDYNINEKSTVPKYDQLRTIMLDYITNLPPDVEYLPYEYEIESQLHVSKRTIRRAFDELRNEGIIETLRKRGSKIVRRDFVNVKLESPDVLLKNHKIGSILVSDVDDPGPTGFLPWRITSALEDIMRPENGSVSVYNLRGPQWQDKIKLKHSLIESGIEWAFVYVHEVMKLDEILPILNEANIKAAFFLENLPSLTKFGYLMRNVDYVAVNQLSGIYQALNKYFTDIDYLVFAGTDKELSWEQPRIDVCRKFAELHQVPFEKVIVEKPLIEPAEGNDLQKHETQMAGAKCAEEILARTAKYKNPLCFAANDWMGAGMMDYFNEHNISIPQQLSLVSYDNKTDMRSYNLSTLGVESKQIGDEFIELFKDFLSESERIRNKSIGRIVFPEIFLRSTTR